MITLSRRQQSRPLRTRVVGLSGRMSTGLPRLASLCWSFLALTGPLLAQTPNQALKLELVGEISEPADFVRVNGTFAYVVAGSTLSVFDIRDPSAPKRRGTVGLPESVNGLAVSGSNAYLANGLRGLAIVDVANPDSPALIGSYKTPGEAVRVSLTGNRAVVANRMSGVEVIDVSNVAKLVSLGSYYTDGYTRDVAVAGSLAYVVDSSNDFAVVDVSRQGPPTALSTQASTLPSSIVAVTQPASGSGAKTVYVLGGGALQVYDVSDPAAPRKGTVFKISDRTLAIAFQGALGYMASGPDGLQILDLSDPLKPLIAGSYNTPGDARDVAVAGPLIFVATAARSAGSGTNATTSSKPRVLILRQSS
jgi:hypothetical protein